MLRSIGMQAKALKADRILKKTRQTMVVQEQVISTVLGHHPLSPSETTMTKHKSTCEYQLLYNMPLPITHTQQNMLSDQYAFLRRVEQVSMLRGGSAGYANSLP